jgi:hypothetical protein
MFRERTAQSIQAGAAWRVEKQNVDADTDPAETLKNQISLTTSQITIGRK